MRIPREARPRIIDLYRKGVSYKDIASEYGTTPQGIGYIVRSLIERGDPLAAGLSTRRSEGAKGTPASASGEPVKTMARIVKPHEKTSRVWSPTDISSDDIEAPLPSLQSEDTHKKPETERSDPGGPETRFQDNVGHDYDDEQSVSTLESDEMSDEAAQVAQRRREPELVSSKTHALEPREGKTTQTLRSFSDLKLVNTGRGKYGDVEKLMSSASEASQSFSSWLQTRDSRDAKALSANLEKLRDAINAMELDLSL